VSVGDSMTFFYRRVPPQSRRKSGVQIIVDESAAKTCKDGDTAHNRYPNFHKLQLTFCNRTLFAISLLHVLEAETDSGSSINGLHFIMCWRIRDSIRG